MFSENYWSNKIKEALKGGKVALAGAMENTIC
jgi:hypothetical protein